MKAAEHPVVMSFRNSVKWISSTPFQFQLPSQVGFFFFFPPVTLAPMFQRKKQCNWGKKMLKQLSSNFFGLNSAGQLLHKTNLDLSYFELSYVFLGHNDSVGRGTTVLQINLKIQISHLKVEIPFKLVKLEHLKTYFELNSHPNLSGT